MKLDLRLKDELIRRDTERNKKPVPKFLKMPRKK
jgi:hypothetical protein